VWVPSARGSRKDPIGGTTVPYLPDVLILHHDVTSPRAAVAVLRLQALADAGYRVGFLGLDVLGLAVSLPVTLDQITELEAVRDQAAGLGLALRRPTLRPPTLDVHLLAELAEREGLGAAWRLACLRAYWSDGVDVSDRVVLRTLARRVGLPPDGTEQTLADTARRNALRAEMLGRRGLGIGGVPVLELDGTLLPADVDDVTLLELVQV
jgi:2-hydroxychromene-2-carboxylate isomerase